MYRLPSSDTPTLNVGVPVSQRLRDFKKILAEELDEIDDIISAAEAAEASPSELAKEEILVNLADLLGDIQVYCASEMRKFGIPQATTLRVIMNSNFSKLGADGKPIYDERGKVVKGPNYWKPEPYCRR
ncbi:MAG: pyrophosphatase [Rhodocyclaceae bacterium]|nr:pyrophosphatase [Rhodocyclaceae bacterium]